MKKSELKSIIREVIQEMDKTSVCQNPRCKKKFVQDIPGQKFCCDSCYKASVHSSASVKKEEIQSTPAPQQQFTTFEEGMKKYELSDPPLKKNTIRQLDFSKSGLVIPQGTSIEIRFSKTHPSNAFFFYEGRWRILNVITLWGKVSGIGKPPSQKTMMKWNMDGVAKSVLGRKIEPDGWDQNGSPSWLLALGLI